MIPETSKRALFLGALFQRGGDVRFRMMERITADRVGEVIAENADLTCRVITDG
jgi:hypothetical protein